MVKKCYEEDITVGYPKFSSLRFAVEGMESQICDMRQVMERHDMIKPRKWKIY